MLSEATPKTPVKVDVSESGIIRFRYTSTDDAEPAAQRNVVAALFELSQNGPVAFVVNSGPNVQVARAGVIGFWVKVLRARQQLEVLAVVTPHTTIRVFLSTFAAAVRAAGINLEAKAFSTDQEAIAWARTALRQRRGG